MSGLEVASFGIFTNNGSGSYDSVLLTGTDGLQYLFRVPRTKAAAAEQQEDLRALAAFSPGLRARLPFGIPLYQGTAEVGPTEGVLYRFVPGTPMTLTAMQNQAGLASDVGIAVAAIHSLPTSFVDDYALPHQSAIAVATEIGTVLDAGFATGRLSLSMASRWEEAIADDKLWDFQPTVVHGDLSETNFLIGSDGSRIVVTGILNWKSLRVGDPAADLAWFIDLPSVADSAIEAYLASLPDGVKTDPYLQQRAQLHREISLVRWLNFGVEQGDEAIAADGERMLAELEEQINNGSIERIIPERVVEVAEVEVAEDDRTGDEEIELTLTIGDLEESELAELEPITDVISVVETEVVGEPTAGEPDVAKTKSEEAEAEAEVETETEIEENNPAPAKPKQTDSLKTRLSGVRNRIGKKADKAD